MIHQFIFAAPKPGLSAAAFASYWINFHAVDFAAKIPQIRQYLVAARLKSCLPWPAPTFEGVAEIWLANDADQIASLQTPEFLDGARRDEPRWAAFWQTYVLDTDPHLIRVEAPEAGPFIKLYLFHRRSPGMPLEEFRQRLLDRAARQPVTGAVRHLVGLARDGLYGFGEPRHDAIEVVSFTDEPDSAAWPADFDLSMSDPAHLFTFVGREAWIIPPGARC